MSKGKLVKDDEGNVVHVQRRKNRFYFFDSDGNARETDANRKGRPPRKPKKDE